MLKRTLATFVLAGAIVWPQAAGAQEVLQRVRDLYASAAYEDALAVLARSGDELPTSPELGLYRVSCLVALNRPDDADRAIEEIVRGNPLYRPGAADASPRIQELFKKTRERVLPAITRQMYANAKTALDRKDRAAAIAGFDQVVKIIDAGGVDPEGTLADMRLLAAGFLDLSRALPAPEVPPLLPPPANETPRPAAAAPKFTIVPPQPLNQVLPVWQPPDNASRQTEFKGAIRLLISATGSVVSAEIVQRVHPVYDPLLLLAAKQWLYKPATRNGVPIASEQILQVHLRPR